MALEIEAPRFRRSRRGRQMPSHHQPVARQVLRQRLVPVDRHAHPLRHPVGRHPLQPDLIQRQPHRVAGRAVDIDHAAFDRPVVAKRQHRPRDPFGLDLGQPQPRADQCHAQQQGLCGQRHHAAQPQRHQTQRGDAQPDRQVRFHLQREIEADPQPEAYRHPAEERAALIQQGRVYGRPRTHLSLPRDLHYPPWTDPRASR